VTVALRQPVLAVRDLARSLAAWRAVLGTGPGARDPEMAAFGLDHEVLGVGGETFLELLTPIRADAAVARHLSRLGGDGGYGDGGYMVTLHIRSGDAGGFRARTTQLGYKVAWTSSYRGSDIVQFHPREFGTLLQVSHVDAPWHWLASVGENTTGTVADAITAVQIAVPDRRAMAAKWAAMLGIGAAPGATMLPLDQGTIEFVRPGSRPGSGPGSGPGSRPGLVGLSVHAVDRARAGDQAELSGVVVSFV
jgi:catechol 2,3-dioxygenase-like lactoylglutathione lyase family enzyme